MKYLIIIFLSIVKLYAIITIVPVNIGDKAGVSGSLKGSFATQRGNSDTDNYTASAKLQYDNNISYVAWAESAFNYGESSSSVNTKNSFSHLRYIHSMYVKKLNWESFLQSQTNEFTRVKDRYLSGAGLRYHIDKKAYGEIYFGVGAFYEFISYTTSVDPTEHNIRFNVYTSYTKNLTKDAKLSYLIYMQPKYEDFADYIMTNKVELNILIYKKLYLNFNISYNRDASPAIGVKKFDAYQKTSFLYEF